MSRKITIGSRGSDLALWQADHVKAQLEELGHEVKIKVIKTKGDKIQNLSFDKLEGKGFFTKELEEALLDQSVDLAVHSHKDLPTEHPEGLVIAAVSEREDPADLLLINRESTDFDQKWNLMKEAVVGTGSARRKAQLLHHRPDIELKDLRGNVPTRIQKLKDEGYDAIMLAAAGISRLELDLSAFHVERLNPKVFVPAPAQGVLGLQIRESDSELATILEALNDAETAHQISVERRILNLFQGGCQMPLGAYAKATDDKLSVWVAKAESWDKPVQMLKIDGEDPEEMAQRAVKELSD